ncbi:substrate-binding domain-containing protein [Confluentibacter flavum]|uniref:LacI family transcriptional regulator n=1 Tax=Confluentibacter flavum TaxID=1909700 RepID=A0A2N3HHG0_9FLAO|nr:substrate-binding domain-containing protein [Confluentibacter flavum]PKQ44405.1 LacI family transcriptional regulator [Confluentibacter flavum]
MKKKYTIRDIAELAGVSKGTVDRVIHNRGKVSKKALERITKLLTEIDYEPNLIARNLKNNKVYDICVLMPDPEVDPYWSPCTDGIKNAIIELKAFGVNILTVLFNPQCTKSFLNENENIQIMLPDAVVLVPLFNKESLFVLEKYEELGIIVSTFNNRINSATINKFVGQDLFQSGRIAAKLLYGLRKSEGDFVIIHIDEKYKNAIHMQEKEKGFKSFFDESLKFKNKILTCKLKHPNFESQFNLFLNEHKYLTGIFVTTSKVYQVAEIIKNRTQHNISIVGYDLLPENVAHLKEGTIDFLIHQNPKQQAYLALKYLVDFLLFEKEIPNELLLPIDIINSENVEPFMGN